MSKLSQMCNIGKELEKRLVSVGIDSAEKLMELGSRQAFLLLRERDKTTCINTLYALEGAVLGVRWHGMDEGVKMEIKSFWERLNLGDSSQI